MTEGIERILLLHSEFGIPNWLLGIKFAAAIAVPNGREGINVDEKEKRFYGEKTFFCKFISFIQFN